MNAVNGIKEILSGKIFLRLVGFLNCIYEEMAIPQHVNREAWE